MINYIENALRSHKFKSREDADKWLNRYIRFIDGCLQKQFNDDEVFQVHHIMPRSWDRNKQYVTDTNNLIRLPLKYHVVAHQLLARTKDHKMKCAFQKMVHKILNDTHPFNYNITLRLIEEARFNLGRPVMDLNTGEIFMTGRDASIKQGIVGDVSGYIKTKSKCKGHYFQYLDVVQQSSREIELQKMIDNAKEGRKRITASVAVPIINLTTGQVFESAYDADRFLNEPLGTIKNYIKWGARYKGDYWAFKRDVDATSLQYQRSIHYNKKMRPVVDLLTGKVYDSGRDAARARGDENVRGDITGAIRLKRKRYGTYWEYKDVVDQYGIPYLLEQIEKTVAQNKKNRTDASAKVRQRKIINVVDGTIYESGVECSRAFGKCDAWAQAQIANKRSSDNVHLMYYDEYLKTIK